MAGEHRPDGSFMPHLDPVDGHKLSTKEFADGGSRFRKRLREVRQGANL